eukprot:TRINITY_DN5348_c0_g1_i1.p1 TRINITY_DN5348_c0_g1~~TRINITY_DN5348_c0_g1_i1.p1  ORF type:complete len:212 (-),score=31.00 TRINITY_DN5348_c0_g1_i1:29-664(-)
MDKTDNTDSTVDYEDLPPIDPIPEGPSTTDTPLRYLAYLARLRTLALTTARYVAYSSDVGEAFRPVVPPIIVTGCYALSWVYVLGDVSYEGYKTHAVGADTNTLAHVVIKRGVFQSLASMMLPAILIHTQVNLFSKVFKKVGRFQRWGPTIMGLSLVPALPYIFDHPVEHAVEWAFDKVWPLPGREGLHHHGAHEHEHDAQNQDVSHTKSD